MTLFSPQTHSAPQCCCIHNMCSPPHRCHIEFHPAIIWARAHIRLRRRIPGPARLLLSRVFFSPSPLNHSKEASGAVFKYRLSKCIVCAMPCGPRCPLLAHGFALHQHPLPLSYQRSPSLLGLFSSFFILSDFICVFFSLLLADLDLGSGYTFLSQTKPWSMSCIPGCEENLTLLFKLLYQKTFFASYRIIW